MKKFLLSALLASALALPAMGNQPNVLKLKETITDETIVFPETFEKDTQKLLESWYLKNYTTTDDRYARQGDVEVSDEEIKRRLAALPTVIDMPYNQIVRDYIKRYTKRGRDQVAAILGLSLYYTPIFEQALEQAGLPLELKYLPVIESALDPNAVSKSGATGLWQLMLGTGKGLGLEVNSLVDERRDPYLSSEKAVSYLKDLYGTYGDWSLAIAAYNCGPGAVNKALRRAGGDPKSHDFWSIYKYLSPETRGYVPMFIAANYVMNYHNEHNISPVLATKPLITDTVAVYNRLHFNQISDVLNMPVDELRILNPQFRADIIPASQDHPYFLILPSQQVHAYLVSEQEIMAHDAAKYARRETAEPGEDAPAEAYEPATSVAEVRREEADVAMVRENAAHSAGQKAVTHKVASGETISSIAAQYGCSSNDIKEWNNLRRNAVRVGQQLKIYTTTVAETPAKSSNPTPANTQTKNKQTKQTAEPVEAATPKTKKKKNTQEAESQAPAKQQPAKSKKTTNAEQPKEQAKTSAKNKKQQQTEQQQTKGKKNKKNKETAPKNKDVEVKNGDSLSRIAKKNGVTVEELRKANPSLKSDVLHPGDKLKLPAKTQAKQGKKGQQKTEATPAGKSKKGSKSKKKR